MGDKIREVLTAGLRVVALEDSIGNVFTICQDIYNYKGLDNSQNHIMEFVETKYIFTGSIIECKAFMDLVKSGNIDI